MGRHHKLTLDFFLHDAVASSDRKIRYISKKHGNDGYATYFRLLEMLCREEGIQVSIGSEFDAEVIAEDCHLRDAAHFYRIIQDCVECGLFDKQLWEGERVIFSHGLFKRYESRLQERKQDAERKKRKREAANLEERLNRLSRDFQDCPPGQNDFPPGKSHPDAGQPTTSTGQSTRIQSTDTNPNTESSSDPDPETDTNPNSKEVVGLLAQNPPADGETRSPKRKTRSKTRSPKAETRSEEEVGLTEAQALAQYNPREKHPPGVYRPKPSQSEKLREVYFALDAMGEYVRFLSLWNWFVKRLKEAEKETGQRHGAGDKTAAAQSYLVMVTKKSYDYARFRKGTVAWSENPRKYGGYPNLCRFIAGSTTHPTPYWQSALDALEEEQDQGLLPAEEFAPIPMPEVVQNGRPGIGQTYQSAAAAGFLAELAAQKESASVGIEEVDYEAQLEAAKARTAKLLAEIPKGTVFDVSHKEAS